MSDLGVPDLAYWSGPGGEQWARNQEYGDRQFAPVAEALFKIATVRASERVVDIGCGCGTTTIALARMVGRQGRVLGIDVSAAMLALARNRAPQGAPVEFVRADATNYAFPRGAFDLLFSRHGVMFFAEPVRAFANLRTALAPGGRLAFSCFRAPRDNPWAMTPLQAAYRFVPPLPKLGPEDPGPFSFADETRVRRILGAAGFADIALQPVDLEFDLAVGRGLDAAVANVVELGPTSRAVQGQSAEIRAKVAAAMRETLAPHVKGETVQLGAAVWLVTAHNPES
ncbi:MAG: methyltransferase domain-containing protein [Alphaproteobacteria bacterium]|nr:methyltransferase domain-containing protein [Alphaproteobacteria bacterium]